MPIPVQQNGIHILSRIDIVPESIRGDEQSLAIGGDRGHRLVLKPGVPEGDKRVFPAERAGFVEAKEPEGPCAQHAAWTIGREEIRLSGPEKLATHPPIWRGRRDGEPSAAAQDAVTCDSRGLKLPSRSPEDEVRGTVRADHGRILAADVSGQETLFDGIDDDPVPGNAHAEKARARS